MHGVCLDPDITAEICEYISQSRSRDTCGLRVYCPSCTVDIDRLKTLESRLRAVEVNISTLLANSKISVSTLAATGTATYGSSATQVTTVSPPLATATTAIFVEEAVAEALEKERRKSTLVIFNIPTSITSEADTTKLLIESLTDSSAPVFTCNRLGTDTNRPLLVKLSSEKIKP